MQQSQYWLWLLVLAVYWPPLFACQTLSLHWSDLFVMLADTGLFRVITQWGFYFACTFLTKSLIKSVFWLECNARAIQHVSAAEDVRWTVKKKKKKVKRAKFWKAETSQQLWQEEVKFLSDLDRRQPGQEPFVLSALVRGHVMSFFSHQPSPDTHKYCILSSQLEIGIL